LPSYLSSFETHLQADSQMRLYKSQADAAVLSQKSVELQKMQLQQDCAVLEGNVTALRRLLSERRGAHKDAHSAAEANPPSIRDSALIAHLETRAKQSEQRAESMMFQKNEAQSRFVWRSRPAAALH
jgi:hypothetical protein